MLKVGDKVMSNSLGDDKRWRAVVVAVGKNQVKIRMASDKSGKDEFWVMIESLKAVKKN